MNFDNLNTYNGSHQSAFEALCNQLFEQWLKSSYPDDIAHFATINGSGGDGGVEAIGVLKNGQTIGLQAKWFRTSVGSSQISQLVNSVHTAIRVRPNITYYIICLPRDFQSEKIGPGNAPIQNSEESRLNAMLDKLLSVYPLLTIEIWNEHRLRKELQRPGNEGVWRFWFEKEIISMQNLQSRFQLAKAGWLQERYVPSLHTQGEIQANIEYLLFTPSIRRKLIEMIGKVIDMALAIINCIHTFNNLRSANDGIGHELSILKAALDVMVERSSDFQGCLYKGEHYYGYIPNTSQKYEELANRIRKMVLPSTFKNVQLQLAQKLEMLELINPVQMTNIITHVIRPNSLIITGGPATGKTHGVVHAVERRLADGLPALVIRAKAVNAASWADILQQAMGGLHTWTDMEILRGLEAVALVKDVARTKIMDDTGLIAEPTRVLICVDGLDEAGDDKNWIARITEIKVLQRYFSRIQFVFTTRAARPGQLIDRVLPVNTDWITRLSLPEEGDVALSKLVPIYLDHYNIQYAETPWLKDAFIDALSLKLFCEKFAGQAINSNANPVGISLLTLLSQKIQLLEQEFVEQQKPGWSNADEIMSRMLNSIAELFVRSSDVPRVDLIKHISSSLPKHIDRSWVVKAIDALCEHGILLRHSVASTDGYSPTSYYYNITYQSYCDYLIAVKATNEIIGTSIKHLPATLKFKHSENAISMTAVALLVDYGILVGEDDYWINDFSASQLKKIRIDALSKSDKEKIGRYMPVLKKDFLADPESRNLVFHLFVLRNLHRPDLNLGISFIHELLSAFPSTYARDLVWSDPKTDEDATNQPISYYIKRFYLSGKELRSDHTYEGLPLILAWSLSSLDPDYRAWARSQLSHWACHRIGDFIRLLRLVFPCNDPQIQEDLSVVMAGVGGLVHEPGNGLRELATWVSDHVFAPDQIVKHNNAIVRHCCRVLMEKAHRLGECTTRQFQEALPPYRTAGGLLLLNFETRFLPPIKEDEYFTRSIAKDRLLYYFHFFQEPSEWSIECETREFLNLYKTHYGKEVDLADVILYASLAFLEERLGYDRFDFDLTSYFREGELDYGDKYVSLAKNELLGYLADRIPYNTHYGAAELIDDYSKMLKIPDATMLHHYTLKDSGMLGDQWLIPQEIAPILSFTKDTKLADAEKWVRQEDTLDFSRWIQPIGLTVKNAKQCSNHWLTLHMELSLFEPNHLGIGGLEVICCAISSDQLSTLIHHVTHLRPDQLEELADLDTWKANSSSSSHVSIKEVVERASLTENDSFRKLTFADSNLITIHSTVVSCYDDSTMHEYRPALIPSKMVRELLGVLYTDQGAFLNGEGRAKAIMHETADNTGFQNLTLVDADVFEKELARCGLVPFWLFRRSRHTRNIILTDDRPDKHPRHFRYWMVWRADGELKSQLFQDAPEVKRALW